MEYSKEFQRIWDMVYPHKILQKKEELNMLYEEIIKQQSRINALEIGTLQGATALFFKQLYENVVSIDNIKRFTGDKGFTFIQGDTHKQETLSKIHAQNKKYDLIMIDGDHNYEGVRMDFENYVGFAKPGSLIVFHDILITKWHINQQCEVGRFWQEIKNNFTYKELCYTGDLKEKNEYVDWINKLHPSEWGGFGVLFWDTKSGDTKL